MAGAPGIRVAFLIEYVRVEAAGDAGPWRQQAILGRGRWDADALRDIVRDDAIEHLGTDDAVLVVDETGFSKQDNASSDVGHQHTGSAGKVTNCQIGVKKGSAEAVDLIHWSVQEISRIVVRLAQRRIAPRHVIARSCWRRAHQTPVRRVHIRSKT